ncbi:hypothetical protein CD30_19550 [Ureibacillus massiliensis 4400831 = CIP 108448 = CCUG 49529]|uniref:NERD domain-containing protein n=1 Tax=Ureibacillus massiliensis 4400831 = CIP 108448 = CCUG 49529 TaxID=1211035 RepID=A0A0A3ICU7_9BACL|nr:hypothetical protein [Ureibacillus massiliensis]KGR80643.1 hypothetical protein CD30_19550 [Ureibacillus massiliensis 4400831 = CIP 108448 = CCUG 49529]
MTNLSDKILIEENGKYQFDFSALDYVWEIHDIVSHTTLNDVDFITETEKEVLFIEYKNANIEDAVNPGAMLKKIKHESFYYKIARKFYDSLLLFWACKGNEKELPIVYVLIIEHPLLDKKLRRQLKLKIEKQLPFELNSELIAREIISQFEVVDLTEWKNHFPQIEIRAI